MSIDAEYIQSLISDFRLTDLQSCLGQLGLKKTGRKQELQQRLLSVFASTAMSGDGRPQPKDHWRVQEALKVIESMHKAVYGGMFPDFKYLSQQQQAQQEAQSPGAGAAAGAAAAAGASAARQPHQQHAAPGSAAATGLSSHHHNHQQQQGGAGYHSWEQQQSSAAAAAKARAPAGPPAVAISPPAPRVVRCVCGSMEDRGDMVQCKSERCGVYQHARCMAPPALSGSAPPRLPGHHYCERCRAARMDPFWAPHKAEVMQPGLLKPTGRTVPVGSRMEPAKLVERQFTLWPNDQELIRKQSAKYQLQALCFQLSDTVPFRCHWPLSCDLRVNGIQYHVYRRTGYSKLGANQRDEPASIGTMCSRTQNVISLSCADGEPYLLVVQLVRARSLEEVRGLMQPPLPLDKALDRVVQLVGGDDEIEVANTIISLKDPLTGSRIRTPARFSEVQGLPCFDLDALLETAQRSKKWQCPHSMRHSSVYTLQIDTYTNHVLQALADFPEVTEVEIAPDGRWRPAGWGGEWQVVGQTFDAAAARGQGAPVRVKGEAADGQGGAPCGACDEDSDDEADEMEELRQAARAVKQQAAAAKRARELPEVIDLLDSDDDDAAAAPPPAKRQQTLQQAFQPAARQAAPPAPPAVASAAQTMQRMAEAVAAMAASAPQASAAAHSNIAGSMMNAHMMLADNAAANGCPAGVAVPGQQQQQQSSATSPRSYRPPSSNPSLPAHRAPLPPGVPGSSLAGSSHPQHQQLQQADSQQQRSNLRIRLPSSWQPDATVSPADIARQATAAAVAAASASASQYFDAMASVRASLAASVGAMPPMPPAAPIPPIPPLPMPLPIPMPVRAPQPPPPGAYRHYSGAQQQQQRSHPPQPPLRQQQRRQDVEVIELDSD